MGMIIPMEVRKAAREEIGAKEKSRLSAGCGSFVHFFYFQQDNRLFYQVLLCLVSVIIQIMEIEDFCICLIDVNAFLVVVDICLDFIYLAFLLPHILQGFILVLVVVFLCLFPARVVVYDTILCVSENVGFRQEVNSFSILSACSLLDRSTFVLESGYVTNGFHFFNISPKIEISV